MKSECNSVQNEPEKIPSVFSGMFSLLHERVDTNSESLCFKLPNIFEELQAPQPIHTPLLPSVMMPVPQRATKENTACPHKNRKHYAKNMCNNCYHRLGRVKAAWACPHTDRRHYAKGKCQFCYIQSYHRDRVLREDSELKFESLNS
ncbi:unnamed protein product [Blepharisma stoltei]|uniref:Uncharacterized protein n=1 Tax=Blepharisma stoltei TaxID=1481888 RepID=A0AAU9JKV8_9CILI|nr:unnamed protein product [Blepharisma stoltei]